MGALVVGCVLIGEGEDAEVVEGGHARERRSIGLFIASLVGPEPSVNLRPLSVLVTILGGVAGVQDIL